MTKTLKNWTVIGKTISYGKKGLLTYLRYLTNNSHPNHLKENHTIKNYNEDIDSVFLNMCKLVDARFHSQVLSNKGGRPPKKLSHSFTINLPFSIKEEQEDSLMENILREFFNSVIAINNIEISSANLEAHIVENNFFNIHKQPKGSQTQLNLVLTEYINGTKMDLSKKKYSYLLKNIVNEETRKIGFDHNTYFLEDGKPQKKRISIGKYKSIQLDKKRKELDLIFQELNTSIEEFQELKSQYKTLFTYLNRSKDGIEAGDVAKSEKNLDLSKKYIQKYNISF